jgi:antitoxin HicB
LIVRLGNKMSDPADARQEQGTGRRPRQAHTCGDSVDDALMHAADALATVIDAYINDRRDIPSPSVRTTTHRVTVPALVEAKIRLYETMREAKIGKSELAKRLDWHLPQVDRLLAMTHGSKLEQLESAFRAMGTCGLSASGPRYRGSNPCLPAKQSPLQQVLTRTLHSLAVGRFLHHVIGLAFGSRNRLIFVALAGVS